MGKGIVRKKKREDLEEFLKNKIVWLKNHKNLGSKLETTANVILLSFYSEKISKIINS